MMAEVCATNLSQLIMESILGGASRLSNKKSQLTTISVIAYW